MTGINKNRRGKPEQVSPTSTKPDRVSGRGSKHFVHRVFKKCEVMKCIIIIIIINIINIFIINIIILLLCDFELFTKQSLQSIAKC